MKSPVLPGVGPRPLKMGKKRKAAKAPQADGETLIFSGGEESDTFESYSKMGLICFEEITGEEAAKYLRMKPVRKVSTAEDTNAPGATTADKKVKKQKNKTVKETGEIPEKNKIIQEKSKETVAEFTLNAGDLPEWRKYPLDDSVLLGLKRLGFTKPTPIQKQTLDVVFDGGAPKDVLGTAPTGSGKTLAFGLPILNYIARRQVAEGEASLAALIIAPTRELALQIKEHLHAVSPALRLATLIGGMSSEKQERLLTRDPHILIGTPGRLDDCMGGDEKLASLVTRLPFLVIDEADRLVESGHFKELDSILAAVYRDPTFQARRTFLFSATLDFEDGQKRTLPGGKNPRSKAKNALAQLRAKIRFCSPSPMVISLAGKNRVADSVSISRLYALPEEKDLFLMHHLLTRPALGKVLVFVNAIEILKRVAPVLSVFGIPATTLHAQMQQRQRLQHLDKFRAAPQMVLVTSDVAARGLDLPAVDEVIHYHLPPTADTFVHRSGRTGRAQRTGSSLALVAPQELPLEATLAAALKLGRKTLPEHPVELSRVEALQPLVDLARRIETLQTRTNQANKNESWEAKVAADLGFDIDDDFNGGSGKRRKKDGEEDGGDANKRARQQLAALQAEFASMRKSLRL